MRELIIIRHGLAEDRQPKPGFDDRARRLTPQGRKKFRDAACGLRRWIPEVNLLLTSPLIRARETAAILTKAAQWPEAKTCAELDPAEEPAAEIELRDEEPAPEPPEMRIVPSAPQQQPQPEPAADIQGLIGPNAAAAATSALTSLVQAVDASRGGTPIGHGNRTIEDLVKDVMRPMIKDWLDTNLPRLVERLVRKEIERLSHNAEDD